MNSKINACVPLSFVELTAKTVQKFVESQNETSPFLYVCLPPWLCSSNMKISYLSARKKCSKMCTNHWSEEADTWTWKCFIVALNEILSCFCTQCFIWLRYTSNASNNFILYKSLNGEQSLYDQAMSCHVFIFIIFCLLFRQISFIIYSFTVRRVYFICMYFYILIFNILRSICFRLHSFLCRMYFGRI